MRIYRIPKAVQRIFPKILWSFPEKQHAVYLTFDDGPHEKYTPQILDILDEHDIKSTFFLLGEKIRPNKKIILRMQNSGHSIGIHGYHHIHLLLKSKQTIHEQIVRTKDELESITGEPVRFFRPPYGMFNRSVLELCRQLSLLPVLWSFMTFDFDRRLEDNYLLNIFRKKIRPADIITLHDGHENSNRTVTLLPQIIVHIRKLEFQLWAIEM